MITEHNATTGEITTREMNAEELAQQEIGMLERAAQIEAKNTKIAEKAALLNKLGITEDEAKLLLGGN